MLQAVHLIVSSKKGISAHQLSRVLEVQYKTAWLLAHRIREAMRSGDLAPFGGNGGVVEVDETSIGQLKGVEKKRAFHHKMKVLALVDRDIRHPEGVTTLVNRMVDSENHIERFLTSEETRRLQAAVEASPNTQLKYIVALLLLTGCRKRELLDAKWEEFQLDRQTWRIPMHRAKTSKTRHVPLSKAALEVLNQLPRWESCPYVIPNPATLEPYHSVFHAWDKVRKEAGLPDVRMHDLRHSAASNLVNSGQSLYVVGTILGHAQTKTTQRYAHLANDTLLAAANAAADHMGTDWSRKAG